jgi:excisionase family DNA binding protein
MKNRVEKIYNIAGVRALVPVSRSTIIAWIRDGKLRAFKLAGGRTWRIRHTDLATFLAGKEGSR